jgi:hypothetical protein
LYETRITDLSKRHLKELSNGIDEDIYLLGGWAVHHVVNENFSAARYREYIGSRDIDIGFHFENQWDKTTIKSCSFVSCIEQLQELGFQWQGFRLYKDFDYETLKALSPEESAKRQYYEIIKMYVDPIVDTIHRDFQEICGYNPIDEPLLSLGFKNNWFIKHNEFDNIKVTMPHLLLAMKMNSVLNRDKEDKRIKDMCDIFALMWHSTIPFEDIKTRFRMIYDKKNATNTISQFTDQDISRVEENLGIPSSEIKAVLTEFSR